MYGTSIKRAIERHQLSAAEAAAAMGYKRPDMLYRILRNEADPSLDALQKLADKINIPIGDLLPNSGRSVASDELRDILAAISGVAGRERDDVISALSINARVLANAYRRSVPSAAEPREAPANVATMPERTTPTWSEEFPVNPSDFNDQGDTDYPLELHGWEVEDVEAAAGATGFDNDQMGTTLLNSKEVRTGKLRAVRVRGDSMAPAYEDGWKLAVDVTNKRPQQDDPVIVYKKDEGTVLGWWSERAGKASLLKENEAYPAVPIQDGDIVVGVVAHVAWKPAERRKRRTS